MKAVVLTKHFQSIEDLDLQVSERPTPMPKSGECLIKVASSGVNPSDLFHFYRANQEVCGINTVDFGFQENKAFLDDLKDGFESKALSPLPISQETIFSLDEATQAYQKVFKGSREMRVIILCK